MRHGQQPADAEKLRTKFLGQVDEKKASRTCASLGALVDEWLPGAEPGALREAVTDCRHDDHMTLGGTSRRPSSCLSALCTGSTTSAALIVVSDPGLITEKFYDAPGDGDGDALTRTGI